MLDIFIKFLYDIGVFNFADDQKKIMAIIFK